MHTGERVTQVYDRAERPARSRLLSASAQSGQSSKGVCDETQDLLCSCGRGRREDLMKSEPL